MRAAALIVAVAFLTAGAGMVVGIFAADSTGARVTCLVLALVCLPIGVGAALASRTYRNVANVGATKPGGVLGRATVLDAEATGITVDDNSMMKLRLSVEAGSLPDYEIEITQMLPTDASGKLARGSAVAVWVDIHDSDKVAVDLSERVPRKRRAAVASHAVAATSHRATDNIGDGASASDAQPSAADAAAIADAHAREAHVLATGTAGQATVIRAADAASRPPGAAHAPLVTYELNVQPGDGSTPYLATVTSTTPPDVPVPAPGRQVTVKITPGDDHQVAIDWTTTAPS